MIYTFHQQHKVPQMGTSPFLRLIVRNGAFEFHYPSGFLDTVEEKIAHDLEAIATETAVNSHGLYFEQSDRNASPIPLKLLQIFKRLELEAERFKGGVFGAMAYDFVRFLEPRLQQFGYFKDINPVVPDFEMVVCRNLSEGDVGLKSFVPSDSLIPNKYDSIGPEIDAARLRKNIQQLRQHLKAGDIFQAVISEKKRLNLNLSPMEVYEVLPQAPLKFFFPLLQGILFGASPELLLLADGDHLETHPIAGTRPRGENEDQDAEQERNLLRSSKERAEHMMLVDLARNDLGRVSVEGSVHVAEMMSVKKFTSVQHLVSRVVGRKIPELHRLEALFSCFPAGTLSGAPKVRAMEILADLESSPRGFYGGSIFHDNLKGCLQSYITIRSCLYSGGQFELQAGAGIVLDSKIESEQAEIHNKLKALQRTLEAKNGATHRQLRFLHIQPQTTHSDVAPGVSGCSQ